MTIKLKQRILLQAIDIHRHLVTEIKIQFLENSIRIKSVDPAHYEMVITDIPKRACEEYDLRENKLEIGIDLIKLKEFLRLFKKDDVLTFDYDPENNRLLGKQGYLTRGMGLLDTAGWNSEKTPKVDLKNMVSVDTKIFYASLKGIISSKNYEQTSIIVIRDGVMLEKIDEDEDKDKRDRAVIMQDTGALTVNRCKTGDNNYTIFRSDILIKQVNEYRKCFDHMTIETSPEEPIRITGSNDCLQVEYWLAPIIKDTEDIQPIEDQEKVETQIAYETNESDSEIIDEDRLLDPEQEDKTVKEEIPIKINSDRLSIRRPKGLPYQKHQWTIDMEQVKDMLKEALENVGKQALSEAARYNGFVFFVVHSTDKVEVDDITGETIIENLLPGGFVLIAWHRYRSDKWFAQTVETVK